MLKTRIVTGLIMVALLIGATLLAPAIWLAGIFGLVILGAAAEWGNMSGLDQSWQRAVYIVVTALALAGVAVLTNLFGGVDDGATMAVLNAAIIWWGFSLLWVQSYPGSAGLWGSRWARCVMGLFALVPAWLAIFWLRLQPEGEWLILFVFALVAFADIGAYFFGKAFGNSKLAPKVSPGKSWAGVWGGLLTSIVFICICHVVWPGGMAFELITLVVVGVFTVLVSVLGDLTESMVKRHHGIKDSGTLLPGHGGIMDRIDGHCAAFPVFVLGILLAGGI